MKNRGVHGGRLNIDDWVTQTYIQGVGLEMGNKLNVSMAFVRSTLMALTVGMFCSQIYLMRSGSFCDGYCR